MRRLSSIIDPSFRPRLASVSSAAPSHSSSLNPRASLGHTLTRRATKIMLDRVQSQGGPGSEPSTKPSGSGDAVPQEPYRIKLDVMVRVRGAASTRLGHGGRLVRMNRAALRWLYRAATAIVP
jgi:hypothetical protein